MLFVIVAVLAATARLAHFARHFRDVRFERTRDGGFDFRLRFSGPVPRALPRSRRPPAPRAPRDPRP